MRNRIEHPKVFISYAWGTKDYQMKVLAFATSLKSDGIDVVIDKWSVEAGNDMNSFMEKSVSDPSITNVLILLDENYVVKADGRQGGVGTETQIISQEVYNKVDQNKFVPIIFERNANNEVCKPIYLKGSYHFDLSIEDNYDEQYKNLVRSLYGVDTYKVPELGTKPQWVDEQISLSPKTLSKYDSLKETSPRIIISERFSGYLVEIKEAITSILDDKFSNASYEEYLKHYDSTRTIRSDYLTLLTKCVWVDNYSEYIADFFESTFNSVDKQSSLETEISKIFIHELFISTIAYLLKRKMYAGIGYILGRTYFYDMPKYGKEKGDSFIMFYSGSTHSRFDNAINERDNKKYYSGTAHYWVNNIDNSIITKADFTAADLLCFNYAVYGKYYNSDYEWFPVSYIYDNDYNNSIYILARLLVSKEKVHKILPLFNHDTIESFISQFMDIEENIQTKRYRDYRYPSCFESAPLLGSFIKGEEIATVR